MTRKKLLPSLHVYYLPSYDYAHNEYHMANTSEFQDVLVNCIVELVAEIKNVDGSTTKQKSA